MITAIAPMPSTLLLGYLRSPFFFSEQENFHFAIFLVRRFFSNRTILWPEETEIENIGRDFLGGGKGSRGCGALRTSDVRSRHEVDAAGERRT